jgi:hypothetical protein
MNDMYFEKQKKIKWHGTIASIQPRTAVWRYRLDNRTHSHNGYNLFLEGEANDSTERYSVAISEKQQQKLVFRIGDEATGTAWTKKYEVTDFADYYRAGDLKIVKRAELAETAPPPFKVEPPDMATYEQRGARMLSEACYKGKCFQCAFAAMAAVVIEYDWEKDKKYRFESFCYGPYMCKFYKMGRRRAVPYKNSDTVYDEGYFDDMFTRRRVDGEWEVMLLD